MSAPPSQRSRDDSTFPKTKSNGFLLYFVGLTLYKEVNVFKSGCTAKGTRSRKMVPHPTRIA